MKRVVALLVIMLSATGMAQRGDRSHNGGMEHLTAAQIATLRTKKMTLVLDLTEEQQTRIQAFNLKNAEHFKTRMAQRKAQRNNATKHRPGAEERFERKNQRLDSMIAHKEEMKQILSDAQYAKWVKMSRRNMQHRNHKRGYRSARR